MIDLHAHVLPGIDDGPPDVASALEWLATTATSGVGVVAATPHVSNRYPTTPEAMEHGLAELRAEIEARHLAIAVLPGAEIEADRLPLLTAQARRRLSLAGSGRFLLVELPWDGLTAEIAQSVTALAEDGLTPVIAHPERHPFVQEAPARAAAFVERGALFQVTVSSLIGHHGGATRRTARELLELGLVHLLASDGHGAAFRRAGLAEARGAVHDAAMLEWLTQSVPAAIVAGEAPPSAPAVSRPLGRFRRRLLKKWR